MPKIVNHDERREHIIDALISLILRDGFENATMRQIAAEAGFAHGAISRYFPNRQSLITAAFFHINSQATKRMEQDVQGLRGLAALESVCRVILPFASNGTPNAMSRLIISFWDLAAQESEVRVVHRKNLRHWRKMIQRFLTEASQDGELVDQVDIEVATDEIMSRNFGWTVMSALLPENTCDDRVEAGLTSYIASLRAQSATQTRPGSVEDRNIPISRHKNQLPT